MEEVNKRIIPMYQEFAEGCADYDDTMKIATEYAKTVVVKIDSAKVQAEACVVMSRQ